MNLSGKNTKYSEDEGRRINSRSFIPALCHLLSAFLRLFTSSFHPVNCPLSTVNCQLLTSSPSPSRRRPFTLTEILVVIGIMAMLMYIALPAFTKLAKGSGVGYSATNVMSRLGMARGYAVGKNKYVALLMPEYNSRDDSGSRLRFPNNYLYRATRMCYVSKSGPDYNFLSWVPDDSWQYLPVGTVIFRANNVEAYVPTDLPANTKTDNLADGTAGTDYSVVKDVDCSEFDTVTPANYDKMADVRAIIFKPTGKTVFTGDLYVKVGEGTYSTGDIPTMTNTSNWKNILVDQFIGRINVTN